MKPIVFHITLACIVVAGLFIGLVKGHDARSKWVSKMKIRQERRVKLSTQPQEIILDEYEVQSFHKI